MKVVSSTFYVILRISIHVNKELMVILYVCPSVSRHVRSPQSLNRWEPNLEVVPLNQRTLQFKSYPSLTGYKLH